MTPWLIASGGAPVASLELDPWLGLALGLFLVFLNGFFVAAEFALVKVRPTQLDPYVTSGNRPGRVARHMVRHLDAYLSATQLGVTFASLALGWVGEPAFVWLLEPIVLLIPGANETLVHSISLTSAFIVISILHIVLGELAPKSLAIRRPTFTSLWISIPLYLFYKVTYPAIWVLNHAANAVLKAVGIDPVTEGEHGHDVNELRLLLASTHASVLSSQKRRMLDNILALSDRPARRAMVPRADVVYLSLGDDLEENLKRARESGHTRFPLCDGDLDHVIGLVHIKDVFRGQSVTLEEVRREIALVPGTLPLDRLLRRMRRERVHMAAVLDEYGGVSGIVTLENVIEEIVGEIQDEFDLELPELVKQGEGTYVAAGSVLVEELERALDLEFSDRDEDTIAGVVLSELGRRPRRGDKVEVGVLKAEVLEVDGNRITKLQLNWPVGETAGDDRPSSG